MSEATSDEAMSGAEPGDIRGDRRPDGQGARLARWAHGDLKADLKAVLPAWLTARVLVGAGYVVATAVANRLVGEHPEQLRNGLVAWDGTWYRDIARHGYASVPRSGVRFFPLFPLLGRLLAVPLAGHTALALVLLANAGSIVAAVALRRLVLAERGDAALANRAVWCLMLFPSAFVLVMAYAESLMLVASICAFGFLRGRRWWWAAAFGAVAALSRPLGVVLVVPALVEVALAWRASAGRDRVAGAAAVAGPVVGLGIYLAWVGHVYGSFRLPFTVQDELRGGIAFPVNRVIEGFRQLAGSERFGDGLHVPLLVVLLVLVVLTFRWWPLSYGLYAAAIVVTALSAENLNSIERYGMSAFPLLLALAVLSRPPQVERVTVAVLGGGLVALSSMAWLGAYVP